MKHIKPIENIILESRAPRQLYHLYYVSDREIGGRSYLPHADYRTGVLVVTYPMIQDAVRYSTPDQHIYHCLVSAAIGTEEEFREWLLERGYDPEEYFESLEEDLKLPGGADPEEFRDLRWSFDGLEVGDKVLVWDLSIITNSIYEVQASEIERMREKLR